MNKLLTLCTPLIESGDFYAGAKGEKTGPISREYLTDFLKCYIDKTDSLYSKILSLVTKPAEDIPDDHQPVIKLLNIMLVQKPTCTTMTVLMEPVLFY